MEQLVFSPGMNISENLSREIICLVAISKASSSVPVATYSENSEYMQWLFEQ